MSSSQKTFLIAPACDRPAIEALSLPVCPLFADITSAGQVVYRDGPAEIIPQSVTFQTIAFVAISDQGQTDLEVIRTHWTDLTGKTLPVVAAGSDRAAILEALVGVQDALLADVFAHNAALLQDLATLRRHHETLQLSWRKLEHFVQKTSPEKRWLVQSHGAFQQGKAPPVLVPSGSTLTQQFAASSGGASDIGVHLPTTDRPTAGTLDITLDLPSSGDRAATWRVDMAKVAQDWLRLSLCQALDPDDQTMLMSLTWNGPQPLPLSMGIFHPDPTYCAQVDGQAQQQILAHKVWKHVPGSTPPIPVGGVLDRSDLETGVYYVDQDTLRAARAVSEDATAIEYMGKFRALQVHPRKTGITIAQLSGAVPAGMRHISAEVGNRSPNGSQIEYALAVSDTGPDTPSAADTQAWVDHLAQAGGMSEWMVLEQDLKDQLHLWLAAPTAQRAHLYCLTRPAPGGQLAYGWAMFQSVSLSGTI